MKTKGGFLISQIKQRSGRIFERILTQQNIDAFNGAQGRILYVLWQQDGIAIRELSQKTGLAVTTLTSMLDRMERADLVCRTADKCDRRKTLLKLTPKAQALRAPYDEVSCQMEQLFYQGFSQTEIDEFEGYLYRVLNNLEAES